MDYILAAGSAHCGCGSCCRAVKTIHTPFSNPPSCLDKQSLGLEIPLHRWGDTNANLLALFPGQLKIPNAPQSDSEMWSAAWGSGHLYDSIYLFINLLVTRCCWWSAIQFQFNEYLIWASVCLAVNIYGHCMCSFGPLVRRLSPSIYLNAERSITLLFYCHYYALFLLA